MKALNLLGYALTFVIAAYLLVDYIGDAQLEHMEWSKKVEQTTWSNKPGMWTHSKVPLK
ncbi:hypothetical protein M3223_04055 [Paenibacillus pasadenensis]|uniref:hypothetical protein n=1 Tax=Paenibacillus pasadenensis TaxID=217090 RepID=UPI00204222B0|nr:hypothetical protein [Paenibacillus pasadenensis]MCM3746522.1 hypothetical protein [Paenibacillus pasadenensis]